MSYPTKTYCLSPLVIVWLDELRDEAGSVNQGLLEIMPARVRRRLSDSAKVKRIVNQSREKAAAQQRERRARRARK